MAIDGFLKVPGIEGESEDDVHPEEIEVYSVAWQITEPEAASGSVRSRGRVESSTFDFGKTFDRSSPHLVEALAQSKRFPEIVFTATRQIGGGRVDYLTVELINARVVGNDLDTSDDLLEEIVSLRAQRITIDYERLSPQGGSAGHEQVEIALGTTGRRTIAVQPRFR